MSDDLQVGMLAQSLTRVERLVVMLRYLDELTMEEIGAALALPVERVELIHARIVERARRPRAAK